MASGDLGPFVVSEYGYTSLAFLAVAGIVIGIIDFHKCPAVPSLATFVIVLSLITVVLSQQVQQLNNLGGLQVFNHTLGNLVCLCIPTSSITRGTMIVSYCCWGRSAFCLTKTNEVSMTENYVFNASFFRGMHCCTLELLYT